MIYFPCLMHSNNNWVFDMLPASNQSVVENIPSTSSQTVLCVTYSTKYEWGMIWRIKKYT